MRLSWLLACALGAVTPAVSGCHPSPPTSVDQAGKRPSLAALADRIGRGAPAPRSLVAALPEPVRQGVQAHAPSGLSDDAMLEEARARLTNYSVRIGEPTTSLPLVEGFYLAETVALRPGPSQVRASAQLVTMYEAVRLSASTLGGTGGIFRQIAGAAAMPADPFLPFWEAIHRDGSGQQAAFAAQALRGSPPDPIVIDVLRSMARSLPRETRAQSELRLALFEEIAAREGDKATAEAWLDVAEARLQMDDADGAQRAIEQSSRLAPRAVTVDPEGAATRLASRRSYLIEEQQRVVTIQSLARSTSPEDRLRRASLLLTNQNLPEAQEAYEQLHRDLPHDARPVVGLARLRLYGAVKTGIFDAFLGAHDELRAAADFDHRDGDYYGLRIGLTGFEAARFMSESSDPERFKVRAAGILESLEMLNREYVRFVPDRGAILGFVLQSVRTEIGNGGFGSPGLEKRLHGYCSDGVALAARYPATGDAFRLSLGCASLLDVDRAFEVAFRPLPEALRKDRTLVELRARVLVGLVARHRTFERLAAVRTEVEALPATADAPNAERESLLADLTALAAVAHKGSWQDAVDAYQRARSVTTTSDTPRLSNNLGVALSATLSSPLNQVVVDHLKRSVSIARSQNDQLARGNLAALALVNGSNDSALDLLQPYVSDSNPPLIMQLHLIAAASRLGRTDLARTQAAAALETLRPDNEAHGAFSKNVFVWAIGNFNFSLNTSAAESAYLLKLGGYYDTVLMLPASLSFAEVTTIARPPEPKPEVKGKPKR